MLNLKSALSVAILSGCFGLATIGGCRAPATTPTPTTQAAAGTPVNTMCIVQTDQPADPSVTAVYDGKTYAFCCKDCKAKFLADPAKYVANAK